ncbi:hypothetical protein G9A89_009594 [Geosiphon pyriformis]|nr:hypothetical protein G9A89_009594 [Geosiphon pyriformis]
MSAVLQPIVSYKIQFSYVSACMCEKWNGLLRKKLKIKTSLPKNFSNEGLYYPKMYGLKFFGQLQAKNLLASVIGFANSGGVLGKLFEHRAMDLQAISWMPQQSLSFLVKLSVNPINCFLAGMNMLASCRSLLVNNIPNVFWSGVSVSVADVLNMISGLTGVGALVHHSILDVHLCDFGFANSCLVENKPGVVSIYTDKSVKSLGSVGACGGVTAYFSDVDLSIDIRIYSLLFLTLVELQAITLALKCIPASSSVMLFTNSQAFLNVCVLLVNSVGSNFCDKC